MRGKRRRGQRIDAAADGEAGGKEKGEDQHPDPGPLRAEAPPQLAPRAVQAPLDRPDGEGEELADPGEREVHEVVHDEHLLHVLRERVDGLPEQRGVDAFEHALRGPLVRRLAGVGGGDLVAAGLAALVHGVQVREDLAHPCEERGLLDVVVDAGDDGRERAVHELLGVALVGAEAAGEGHQPRLVFALQPARAAFRVFSQFLDDRHVRPLSTSWRMRASRLAENDAAGEVARSSRRDGGTGGARG